MAGARSPRAGCGFDLLADVFLTAPKEHLNVLLQDLRYTVRMMWKAPAFTAAVVLTVALGIGANTAIFSFVYAVMLRPLPFAEPQRLMQVNEKNDKLNLPNFSASVLNYLSWSEQTQTFDRLGRRVVRVVQPERTRRARTVHGQPD
jgi:putative ABC transport system permease protein